MKLQTLLPSGLDSAQAKIGRPISEVGGPEGGGNRWLAAVTKVKLDAETGRQFEDNFASSHDSQLLIDVFRRIDFGEPSFWGQIPHGSVHIKDNDFDGTIDEVRVSGRFMEKVPAAKEYQNATGHKLKSIVAYSRDGQNFGLVYAKTDQGQRVTLEGDGSNGLRKERAAERDNGTR
jgi:hypothetical protein